MVGAQAGIQVDALCLISNDIVAHLHQRTHSAAQSSPTDLRMSVDAFSRVGKTGLAIGTFTSCACVESSAVRETWAPKEAHHSVFYEGALDSIVGGRQFDGAVRDAHDGVARDGAAACTAHNASATAIEDVSVRHPACSHVT